MKECFDNELVSVIMPAHNSGLFVQESIESVLMQSYKTLELIVVIDGGDDPTGRIVSSFSLKDSRVKPIFHSFNKGIAKARNTALKVALGRFVAFCDSDDMWLPDKLSIQIDMIKNNMVAFSHASAFVIDRHGALINERIMPERIDWVMMKRRNFMINSTAVIDRKRCPSVYQNQIKHEDYDMWLRLFRDGALSLGTRDCLVKYRTHGGNFTNNKIKSLLWMIMVQRANNIPIYEIAKGLFLNFISRVFK